MRLTRPNFTNGFAKSMGESAYPYLWKGLIGAWCPSVGKTGDRLYDFSGYNQKGTLSGFAFTGGTSNYVPGKYGWALDYDGSDDTVDCGRIEQLDTIHTTNHGLTLAFQMKSSTSQTNNAIITYDNNGSLSPSVDMYIMLKTNLTVGGFLNDSELNTGYAQTNLTDGKWHNVVIVGKLLNVKVYVDGHKVFDGDGTGSVNDWSGAGFTLQFAPVENVARYTGSLGDVMLWQRDLSDKEVSLLNSGASPLTLAMAEGLAPSPNATIDASILSVLSSILSPTVIIDYLNDTSILSTLSSIIAPSAIGEVQQIDPSILSAISSILDPSVEIDYTNIPSILSTISSIINPSVLSSDTTASFGSKILSINPLLFVTNTSPAKIIKVDTTDPENITWTTAIVTGVDSLVDAVLNELTNFIYCAGANGIIVKIDISDITSQTIIDVSDTDDITTISHLNNFAITYAGTENNIGELYLIDERSTALLNTDIEVLHPEQELLNGDFKLIQASNLNAKIDILSTTSTFLHADFKCLSIGIDDDLDIPILDQLTPIKQTDFHIYLDDVELPNTDVDLSSIKISKSVDEKTVATFILNRRHDKINYDLNNTLKTITNQNDIKIYIQDNLEFHGNISNLNCQFTNTENILITALGNLPLYNYSQKTLSLPSISSRLGLYDVLINNPQISNPVITSEDSNPQKFKGVFVPIGKKVEQSVSRFTEFDSFDSIASAIENGTFNPKQNWTYFWSPTVKNANPNFNLGTTRSIYFSYIGTSLAPISEDLWVLQNAKHRKQRVYPDKITRLMNGYITKTQIKDLNIGDKTELFNALVSAGYINNSGIVSIVALNNIFEGKDLKIPYSKSVKEALYNLMDNSCGVYLGTAPYKSINSRNGILITKEQWVDENDGLYALKDESYNFTSFVQQVAELEFKKLKNINNQILPDTSCAMTMTIDGYQYFDLQLLNRINLENTIESGIFKNNNGFPLSIKSIIINSDSMNVSFQTDNSKSTVELEQIDGLFPNEDNYITEATSILIEPKTDMKTRLKVQ